MRTTPVTAILAAATVLFVAANAVVIDHIVGFSTCKECTRNMSVWALMYDCSHLCLPANYIADKNKTHLNHPWRSTVDKESDCLESANCTELDCNLVDRSFEKSTKAGEWNYAKTIPRTNVSLPEGYLGPFDGDHFLMTGFGDASNGVSYDVSFDGLKIPEDATHLSVFYSTCIGCSNTILNESITRFGKDTSFTIFLDGDIVFRLDKYNYNHYNTGNVFKPLEITLNESYCDGSSNHKVKLFFTEYVNSDGKKYFNRDFIMVDYFQIIKSTGKILAWHRNCYLYLFIYFR